MTEQENRVSAYLRSLDCGHGAFLDGLAARARAGRVPILRPETAAFLKTMIAAQKPMHILEVGTAVGYSALLMAQAMPPGGRITTIEKFAPRVLEAQKNIAAAGEGARITLLAGDAEEILGTLSGSYDFVFMDAAKGQYIHWLARILALMAPGAVLFSDNVLQDGDVPESRFAVTRRNRTIHSRMREYLWTLTHTEELTTCVIPVGDGVTVSVKR